MKKVVINEDLEFRTNAPEVMTTIEAAKFLSIGADTLRKLVKEGKIPFRKIGNGWIFGKRALLDWVNNQK